MANSGSGAVFFLGTRAHYQVLNHPESRFDVENGNASTETIYQNPSVQELWPADRKMKVESERWYCEQTEVTMPEEKDTENVLRSRRRPSETTLCEKDDMKPALLNALGNSNTTVCGNCSRTSLLTFLWSLARRKKRLATDDIQYLHHIDNVLTSCTYRESCRCLDCQSRYFECDEDSEDYSSDDSYEYTPRYVAPVIEAPEEPEPEDDDEVFVDTVPEDNTSTDLLIETKKMSVSSDEVTEPDPEDHLDIEVAASTPILLNHLLTHPITCCIQ